MLFENNLLKMRVENTRPVSYYLQNEDKEILINDLTDHKISINYKNKINCIACGAETPKTYHQGYCYSCYTSLPETDAGVLRPEQDRAHEGISRDMEWAKKNSLVDHIVYLSLTSNLKVGVTRKKQIPVRWIDQGASKAIRLAKTPYRKLAGDIEVFLKNYVSDKTNWQQMLLASEPEINLAEKKKELSNKLPEELSQFVTIDNRIESFIYPGQYDFSKLKQLSLDKEDSFSGKLIAIRGQYLIFENGIVFNVRRHNGYLVEIKTL